ncbi:MAG: 1-acyl-sn-glycerol-3-phosphate acyltransferase [Clostridia bacterium]|nr:1-acyl-sn-glycerol-3-phosphate acyltransferase [Clostridia bacterium]
MVYDPRTTKFPFPEDTASHYLVVKKNDGTVFDRDYPYVDRSFRFRARLWGFRVLLNLLAFPVATVRMGLKIQGRENLKKHAEIIRNGVISCSNHVHMWDFIAIMKAVRPSKPYVLVWDKNVRGENGYLIRSVRGIPVPVDDVHASIVMMKAVRDLLADHGWVHIYGEGSMWEYYCPIRPFKNGFAHFAIKCDKPVLPLAFSYRKPGWIRKHIFKQIATLTLHVGEPIFRDPSLPREEQEKDLIIRTHQAVCRLAGIDPEENLYPPVYQNSKRIDYYPLHPTHSGESVSPDPS